MRATLQCTDHVRLAFRSPKACQFNESLFTTVAENGTGTAGKPNKPAYEIAAKKLQAQLDVLAEKVPGGEKQQHQLQHVYAVGDNPKSDVRGANGAGNIWRSILVCTGVYKGGVDSNDKEDPAHYVVEGVGEAVDMVFEIEQQRSLGRRTSQELSKAM